MHTRARTYLEAVRVCARARIMDSLCAYACVCVGWVSFCMGGGGMMVGILPQTDTANPNQFPLPHRAMRHKSTKHHSG